MTRIIRISAAACAIGLLFFGCEKRKPNIPPVPDTEVETSIDAAWATYVMTDIDLICSFLGENETIDHYYVEPGIRSGPKTINIPFLRTKCLDGRLRDGTIFMDYAFDPIANPGPDPNANYYHDFRYAVKISLSAYKVDGWLIDEFDPQFPGYIYNKVETNQFDPRVVNMKWLIAGKYSFTHPSDPSRNIVWEGQLYKTLVNTADPNVYSLTRQPAISWPKAIVSYSGNITGLTHANIPFRMEIAQNNQLVRDLRCSADRVVPDETRSGLRTNEHHPFISGIASFTTGNAYPRQIYFGNEAGPDLPPQCDNTGVVLIKGISYKVNFRD